MQETLQLITADDSTLERVLEDAHIPALLNALVHITGDPDSIRGDIRPSAALFGDQQGGITAEQQAEVRAAALTALKTFRDNGSKLPPPPPPALVREMINFVVGAEVPEEYFELLRAELSFDGEDPFGSEPIESSERGDFHVIVVGAGMSGLLAAIRLKEAGVPFQIIEKNDAVGGTWHDNVYPGCRVDSPNHSYSYSFAPNDWPQYYSPQNVLLEYFDRIATEYGLREHIRFETEVEAARYDDASARWSVEVRRGDGSTETLQANAVICAVGQLNRPKLPDIAGIDDFAGTSFHSARWRHDVDLSGKRVIVVGTGASAFQFVPEIARDAAQVTIFQRTPPWIAPRAEYHADVPDGKHWLLNHVPYYATWFRFHQFWMTAEGLLAAVRAEPEWNDSERSVSEANDMLRNLLTESIKAQIGDDEALLAKAIPPYPPAGKRMLVDNGTWFQALKRDNVDVVADPIQRITANGVETESATRYPADVLIFGTGFHASEFLFPMRIYGADSVELHDRWQGEPRAYMGMTIPGYPNLFCLYGPNTNIVVNGSIIFFSECEMRYIMGCLKLLIDDKRRAMACRQDVHDAYNEKIDAANEGMAWGSPHVRSWYKNANGRVTQNWPGTLLEFWQQTKTPNPADFDFS